MKLRHKKTHITAVSSKFAALYKIDVGNDSVLISDLDVCINGEWKDMAMAFRDKDIIPAKYAASFGIPKTLEDKERGYST